MSSAVAPPSLTMKFAWRSEILAPPCAAPLRPARSTSAPADVRGGFAVGLHLPDGRSIGAVDRFAVQTLCYRVVDGELRFAARADELAGPRPEIEPQAIFDTSKGPVWLLEEYRPEAEAYSLYLSPDRQGHNLIARRFAGFCPNRPD